MEKRHRAAVPSSKRFSRRSLAQRCAALLCSAVLLGGSLSACTSPHFPVQERGAASGRGAQARVVPIDGVTSAAPPQSAIAPAPAAAGIVPAASAPVNAAATATPTVAIPRGPFNAAQLAEYVGTLVDAAPAHVAVEIALANGTTLYQHNEGDLYDAASLYKLGIMVQVYKDRDNGVLTFDDPVTLLPGFFYESDEVYSAETDMDTDVPVRELLGSMITLSSNVAAEALLNLVGTDEVNQTMADLGLTNTKILWSPAAGRSPDGLTTMTLIDPGHSPALVPVIARSVQTPSSILARGSADGAYDVTTASDMTILFKQLLSGNVLSQPTSAEMLDLLSKKQINDRLPDLLPAGTKVAHKTGDLDGLLHDAGVIYAPAGPIVVVVMTDEITDHDAIVDLIRRIAVAAYEYTP